MLGKQNFKDEDFKKSTMSPPTPYPCCVEVAHKDGVIAVRNSTDTTKNTVFFNKAEWSAFLGGAKKGEFDY